MESLGFSLWMEAIKLMILCMLHLALAHTPLHFLPHELGVSALRSLVVCAETARRVSRVKSKAKVFEYYKPNTTTHKMFDMCSVFLFSSLHFGCKNGFQVSLTHRRHSG